MAHTFAFSGGSTITVNVYEKQADIQPIIVEHNVLDADHSTFQRVGAKTTQYTFRFWVYGKGNMDYIESRAIAGTIFVYTDYRSNSGSYVFVGNLSKQERMALNYADYWYDCGGKAAELTSTGSLYYQP